jgi:hypothetical protein
MLKRLFISLLILSTLASEGLVNFPANVFSYYLATGKVFDLLEKETPADEQNNIVPNTNTSALKTVSQGSFVLSINSLSKLRYEILRDVQNLDINVKDAVIQSDINNSVFIPSNRLITLRSSDSSPPKFRNNSLYQ